MTTWEIRNEARQFEYNFTGSGFLFVREWRNLHSVDIDLHRHGWHEFVWCRSGEGDRANSYCSSGATLPFGDRCLLYTPPFRSHSFALRGQSRTVVIGIDETQARKSFARSTLSLPLGRLFDSWRTLPSLAELPVAAGAPMATLSFDELLAAPFRAVPPDSLETIHFLVSLDRLLDPWKDAASFAGRDESPDGLVPAIIAFLEANYTKPVGIAECAAHCGVSASTVSHRFARSTGQTVSEWLSDVRLRHARALLAETRLDILDVALECGFRDGSWFSKAFRKAEGISPSEWRRRLNRLP
jgi:AraC-like DNA-binding protein